MISKIGSALVEFDVEATRKAYVLHSSYAVKCTCEHCKNYLLARSDALPRDFLAVLENLGIDPEKEIEVYHCAPLPSGMHLYEGWYYGVGKILTEDQSPFRDYGDPNKVPFGFSARGGAAWLPATFKGLPLFTIDFFVHARWVIDSAPPK